MKTAAIPMFLLGGQSMLARMALGFVCSLALMLQSSQDYPTKWVRLIDPFGAGGGPDLTARAIGPKLSEC